MCTWGIHFREREAESVGYKKKKKGLGRNGRERRLWLFDRLVWTVLECKVEIWEWKERKDEETTEEISKMSYGTRQQNAKIHGERKTAKREVEGRADGRGGLKKR